MVAATRLSGLQKDVLALYRSILREAVRKDRKLNLPAPQSSSSPSTNPIQSTQLTQQIPSPQPSQPPQKSFSQLLFSPHNPSIQNSYTSSTSYARDQFRKEAGLVRRSDFKTIEYKIRKGKKQLQLLKMPGVNIVGGV